MLIRMIKFGLIIICLCSIYTPPLINQQETSIEIRSNSKTLDFPILQNDQKSDWKVNYWRKTWTQKLENSNLASILTTDNDYFVINRTTDFIYKNIQPNCWNDFLEGDRFTQNWHINKRKK